MKVQNGDILIFHSHSLLSRIIQFFMNLWQYVGFMTPDKLSTPNHVAMGDKDNCIIEARAEGVYISPFNDILKTKMNGTIKIYRYPWSTMQYEDINNNYIKYEGRPYQYINFLQYILFIISFGAIWIGRKGNMADKKMYCSELAATIMYSATREGLAKSDTDRDAHLYFRHYWKVSPFVLYRWCSINCDLVTTYLVDDENVTEI